MGEHGRWAQSNPVLPNGLLPNEVASVAWVLDAERWSIAEARISELIERIQPNKPSEELRNAVGNYVQRLIMKCFSCQVFTFGSVPLKTYLPDGDIDMTAFSKNLNLKDTWANEVCDMLENEEKSETAEFRVKEVQYIQAEVKIIKCLVENIVVDISFNQLGGLCTLCFLEEIDHLINQDHLFKRSIILIKAWCYYESRILGAHHGLISTYALETLVLYIFHVFNNSFAGPLEVLYRFLEFFSKFDWDNFCVSLWGPVPISSLPDMTAEPPRKDSGELLLSKLFLDACSSCYSVFPGAQESQGQPFVSKFFNVIDPLRTNNNLGRSVSKGNFYRIRSAFAFGAKRLAGLLECPKDDLIAEVNKFFMNTWKRHGSSGHRPDAPSPDLLQLRPLNVDFVEESKNLKNQTSSKRTEIAGSPTGYEYQPDGPIVLHGIPTQPVNTISQPAQNMCRTGSSSSTVPHTQGQKRYGGQTGSRVADHMERSISSSVPVQDERGQKTSRPDYVMNDYDGQSRFQFARTRSSPELSDNTSTDVSSHGRRNKMPETVKNQFSAAKIDNSGRRKNLGSEVSGSQNIKPSNDPVSLKHALSHQSIDTASDSNCTLDSYHDDAGFASTGEELASVFETLEMHQEEQDLVNMMASPMVHNFNGQVQLPMHFPLSPSVLASMGYSQRNLAGMLPGNIPLLKPIAYPQGFTSSPLPNYLSNAGLGPYSEEAIESGNENSTLMETNQEDNDHGFWHDQDTGSTKGLTTDNTKFQMLHSDEKPLFSVGGFDSLSSSGVGDSGGSFIRGQHKFVRENKGPEREDHIGVSLYQSSRSQDVYSTDRLMNLRFMSTSQSSSSRSKTSSESSWDGSFMRMSKSARDKRGRKPTSSLVLPSSYRNTRRGWYYDDSSSDRVSTPTDDDNRDWIPLSTLDTYSAERSSGSTSLAHPQVRSRQLPSYEPAQMSGSDSVISIAPMLVGTGSQQRTGDTSGVGPLAFYPTGPPVPFLTMLPVYNLPSESGNSDGSSTSQFDRDGRLDNGHLNPSDQNFDSAESLEQPEIHTSPGSMKNASLEHTEEHKPDILHSDFGSHWQNLQFGRFCQNTRYHGPVVCPSPVVVPPMYLQGHLPWDGPGRPLSANVNLFTQIMGYGPQLAPVTPLQPGHSRPSSVYQRYRDEVPRYRGGTGTYLPNPKVSFRDRQSPSARNHRGNYNYDRNDHGDREGSWINSKSRAAGWSHARTQAEKPGSRPDRFAANDNRAERPWESCRHKPVTSYQNQNSSFGSTGNIHGSANMAYGMYPLPAVNSNGIGQSGSTVPSVVMLYSYDPGAGYGSSSEQLEFGSLGPVHLSGMSEVPQHTEGGPVEVVFDQRQEAYQGGSPGSSPDQPSSPQYQHGAV